MWQKQLQLHRFFKDLGREPGTLLRGLESIRPIAALQGFVFFLSDVGVYGTVLFTWLPVSEMSACAKMMIGNTLCKGSVPDRTTISVPNSCSQINVLSKTNLKPRSLPVGGLIRLSSTLDRKAIYGQSLELTPCVGLGVCQTPSRRINFNVQAKAYEASSSDLVPESDVQDEVLPGKSSPTEAAQRLKIGIYFVAWWTLNVVFNIYNKKVLNAFPYPWLTSTLSLAVGSLMMWVSWATRLVDAPDTDFEFWKSLAPVAVAHTIGHVAATVSMSKVAVSFTHIIKSAEPAFSVLVSRFFLGESFPVPVYLSLIPIIGGCALAAATELNFNMTGFMGAMISNLAFVFRNIFSKKGMKGGKSVGGMNYYACLSMLSLALLTPFAFAVEGPQAWAAGWQDALQAIGPQFVWWVAAQSVFYHLYNQVSYMSLNEISPLTFSIGNTMKRVSVIASSIIIFRTPVRAVNGLGAAIAILGTFLYSQAKQ